MLVHTQSGAFEVEIGMRYHVVVRSQEFGNDDYDGTLESIQKLDPNPYPDPVNPRPAGLRVFDFLHFKPTSLDRWPGDGRGARDFTIASLTKLD